MFKFAIEKPVILTVGVLILCLFGVLAIFKVPVQMIPDLDVRVITVHTAWPGATPQDVEKEILVEQEEYLRNIPGLNRMISNASTGRAQIELEFSHGTEINEVLIRVNNALSQVPGYPENVDEPRIVTNSISNNPFMFFRVTPLPGNPKNVNILQLRDFLEDRLSTQLERVPGVSEISIWGGAERQVRIYVDPIKLAERQITLIDLRNAIRARNRNVSGGDMDSGKRRYLLRTIGRFESIQDIEDMVLVRRDDAFVRLRDVGYAEFSNSEIRTYSYTQGVPSITFGIRRQIGSNVVEVMDAVLNKVDLLNEGILKQRGLEMKLNAEDVQYVKDSIKNVRKNLIIGAILATIVLFLFLRSYPATITGALGIPICTVAAFLGLLVTDRTINVISLAGVAFAIGMTLDNSIVVLENIYRHMSQGKQRVQAALDGVKEVWPAILASTLTTIFVFIPIIFVQEEAGQLYSDIAIAIAASIMMSMLIAITLVPATCSRYLSPVDYATTHRSAIYKMGEAFGEKIMQFVDWLLSGLYRRLLLIFTVALATLLILAFQPKAEYLPEGEEQKVFAMMLSPPGYNIEEMHKIYKQVEAHFLPHIGDDPELFASEETPVPGLNYVLGYASAGRIMMIPEATSREHAKDLQRIVTQKIKEVPGVIAFASRGSIFSSNTGSSRTINLELSGPDLVSLFDAGLKAFIRSNEIFDNPQVRPQPSALTMGQPMIEVKPDWERAAELGIEADTLGYTLWSFSDGAFVDEFYEGDNKIDMYLYSTLGTIDQPQDLDHIMLYSSQGGIVPLSAVARINHSVNTETIRRVDGERTITLSIVPPRSVPLETGVEIVTDELITKMRASGEIADDIHMQLTGASDQLTATREALGNNFYIAILISYLLLVAIFSHWGYPFLILTTVPVGISCSLLGLGLLNLVGGNLSLLGMNNFHQPYDVITMLGFVILIGTVVNNPILIVERTIANIRDKGMDTLEAVKESIRTRLRPIMMSSITTVFGLSPLVFNPGAGTELYRGVGAIVMFGLLFSTVITLTFMPALLSLVLQFRDRLSAQKLAIQK